MATENNQNPPTEDIYRATLAYMRYKNLSGDIDDAIPLMLKDMVLLCEEYGVDAKESFEEALSPAS